MDRYRLRTMAVAALAVLASAWPGCSQSAAVTTPTPVTGATTALASAPVPTATPTAGRLDARGWSRKALTLEAERNELVAKALQRRRQYSPFTARELLEGPRLAYGTDSERGWDDILVDLLVLNAPPELQAVKDSLVVAYQMELSAIAQGAFSPDVTPKNVSEVPTGGFGEPSRGWTTPQKLRAQTYARWREILTDKKIALTEAPFNLLAQ